MFTPIKTTDFSSIRLRLASPDSIKGWSYGEVVKPETINYRTQRPEKDGLFCEKIFGPSKDWECYCGKYKKIRYKGIVCDKCGVEVTRSIVRRERMGHIDLAVPVSHIWFLRGVPSRLGLLLDISMQSLEKVIYFANFIVTSVDEEAKMQTLEQVKSEFESKKKSIEAEINQKVKNAEAKDDLKLIGALEEEKQNRLKELEEIFQQAEKELKSLEKLAILSEAEYQDMSLKYGHVFDAGIGAESVRDILKEVDLEEKVKEIETALEKAKGAKKEKLIKRLKLFKSLIKNNVRPEWMILTAVPVTPPDLRPMVPLDGGRFATADLNDLYRRVINRNNRLKQLIKLNAPEVISRNEKRMLQEAVDALIDNGARHGKTVTASTGQKRMLKSLADQLKGKQGRFRQNLLGKRTDYSGRSVIVVGPNLQLHQCGLPKKMALELFKPFIISKLIKREFVHNVRSGSRFIESGRSEVFDILEEIVQDSYVLLNRAPTLHRLGIQAFRPKLIEGNAIQVHPLVCAAFNADFDGDQMAVHVPLTQEARWEAEHFMLASRNLLKPSIGEPIANPSKDMVWGCNYMTGIDGDKEKSKYYYTDALEAKLAESNGLITLRTLINVKMVLPEEKEAKVIKTTVGRIIFNEHLPKELRFVNEEVDGKYIQKLVSKCLKLRGQERTAVFLDDIKNLGFEHITVSGLSWGMDDIPYIPEKAGILEEAEDKVNELRDQYEMGLLTQSERYAKVVEIWTEAKDRVVKISEKALNPQGSVYSMVNSGARGSWSQLAQIIGMKGLVVNPSGEVMELPVKANFKEGFPVLEYFISTHGARKGLADTALRTANSGYLTRRLVDVAQDVIIRQDDCETENGLWIIAAESKKLGRPFFDRVVGRFLAEEIKDAKGKVVFERNHLFGTEDAESFADLKLEKVKIRSVLKCEAAKGVCQKCYGYELGDNQLAKLGTAVGIIAAQSIGEPGTQLTMRTFHSGGIAGSDITQGLPRVEEVFEARLPKKEALLAEVDGKVKIEEVLLEAHEVVKKNVPNSGRRQKIVKVKYKSLEEEKYFYSGKEGKRSNKKKVQIKVADHDVVAKGTLLFLDKDNNEIVAKKGGTVKINDKYISIACRVDSIKDYPIPLGYSVLVEDGQVITKGEPLTEGSINLQDYYNLRGIDEVQKYIINEIQYIYFSQGQKLNDKHIETIVRQMFSRVYITDSGDTDLLPGDVMEYNLFTQENKKATEQGLKPAEGDRLVLGISKVSLSTNSFLSAASFIETAKVLIQAAISGKVDNLDGLKENVIIGRLIPVGTGFRKPGTDEPVIKIDTEFNRPKKEIDETQDVIEEEGVVAEDEEKVETPVV